MNKKKKIFFDDPKVIIKGRYIQPKGKSIGEKNSHRTGRLGRAEKAGKIGRAGKNGRDIAYCGKLSIREKTAILSVVFSLVLF